MEKEDYANYLFVSVTWEAFTSITKQFGFIPGKFYGAEYINSACNLFVLKEPFDKANKTSFQMLFTQPEAWDKLHKMTLRYANELFKLSRQIQKLDPKKLSHKELIKWIDKFQTAQAMDHVPRGPMFLLETPQNLVTEYLLGYLKEKSRDLKKVFIKPFEAFNTLNSPLAKSIWAKEKEGLVKITLIKNAGTRLKRLKRHAKKYEWLEYGLQGKILSLDYFAQELQKLTKEIKSKGYQNFQHQAEGTRRRQNLVAKLYRIHPTHLKIFKIIQDSFHTRLYSKDAQFFGYYCMEPLLREFGRRTALTLEQVRFLAHRDFKKILLSNKDFSHIANERQKYSLFICDKGRTVYFYGNQAKAVRKKLKFFETRQLAKKSESLEGQPAFRGKAKGRVKIINTIPEMSKMHRGNILVSHMTNPGVVPAMKQAAAIVTDLGGITCHAAIVARELKKPCVIGTKFATQIFKDGDLVEVDANKGIVKKL